MNSQQSFERLVQLEDDELGPYGEELADDYSSSKDSCKVPMLQDDDSKFDKLFQNTKHQEINNQLTGFQFTINGRHIRMNPDQLKYLSLLTLTIQNSALNLTMRAAKTQKEQFSTPVAVTVSECLKLLTCLVLVWYENYTIRQTVRSIKSSIIDNYLDTLKVAVPSFVYYVQNNLLYVGSTHLDAATTQVTYQLKILTTAVFSVLMLNKKLSNIQWAALVSLFVGVALIETVVVGSHNDTKLTSSSLHNNQTILADHHAKKDKPLIGLVAILIACCLSGFAGVYFEKILKNTSHVSLWIRNIQLSVVAIPIGLLQVLIFEQDHLSQKGFLYGFTPLTWLCIALQVQGGLLVAVVVKFANNILKGFATSMAIVISTVASIFLFNFDLTLSFVVGASMVIASVMMYNKQ